MTDKTENLIKSYVDRTNDLDTHEKHIEQTKDREEKKKKLSKREIFHISKKNK